jgi:DNA-binding response OmpR family regulator
VLTSRGYESLIATPEDVDEKLQSGKFDLVILSVMLSQEEKRRIQAKLPAR